MCCMYIISNQVTILLPVTTTQLRTTRIIMLRWPKPGPALLKTNTLVAKLKLKPSLSASAPGLLY